MRLSPIEVGVFLPIVDKGSKQLMHVFEDFGNTSLIEELLLGMWNELPEKKTKKKR